MNEQIEAICPQITAEDVAWACGVLGLPPTAFTGELAKDPRLAVLRSHGPLDVEACPGSGKTTLLVAKLAILARRWVHQRSGLCVLSHTNAAKSEIEKRLGHAVEGRRLLSYPHYVGTIHGFVNEFLALPWLRSLGRTVRVIDDHHCEQQRRRLLKWKQFSALAEWIKHQETNDANVVGGWRISSTSFDVVKANGEPQFKGSTGKAATQLRALCQATQLDGYYRYEEMFVWAHDLIRTVPNVVGTLRARFPLLFLDEVQDTDETQAALLFKVFMAPPRPVTRQRFGDANQAIYQQPDQQVGAAVDPFPDPLVRTDIRNSHRFDQTIATLADPLAVDPQGLVGCGPPRHVPVAGPLGKHAVFLFDGDSACRVLEAYAEYLLTVFSEEDLRCGRFTAIGAVHRNSDASANLPRCVGHYWPDYDPELTIAEPKPMAFAQYWALGRRQADRTGEVHHAVDAVAEGVLRVARLAEPTSEVLARYRRHRHLLRLLANHPKERAQYLRLVERLAIERAAPSAAEWPHWVSVIQDVVKGIAGSVPQSAAAEEFLKWQACDTSTGVTGRAVRSDNVFRYPETEPRVEVRLASIHSVKGQTHTGTLVLETFFRVHHLKALKPWILGQECGGAKHGKLVRSRLKQHYVAMTRPTHLLCLAMRRDAFEDSEVDSLKGRSWRVAHVGKGVTWL